MIDYTVLHLHSMDSNPKSGLTIDSITPFEAYAYKAKEDGMKAIAYTEHGSVLHNVAKKQLCTKLGIKYIHGQEFYVTENIDPDNLVRDNYHCILLAKNKDGVKEINYLSSIANNRDGHFFYTPRISLDELLNTSDNVLILTACVAGILCKGTSEAKEKFFTFIINNKHRCWLEIQPHNFDLQVQYNKYLYNISKEYGIPMVATSDVHAVSEDHVIGRSVMQKSKNIVFHDEDECNLVWQNGDGIASLFRKQNALPEEAWMDAIAETNRIADMVEDYDLDYTNKYPRRENAEEEFKKRINAGIVELGINKLPDYKTEYLPRIKEEFETYKKNDAIDFMLLDSDYKNWMRDNGMYYGPSRGSVSGSLIAYLIHSTDVDSIKYDLNFSRFMNPERQSLADVDTDIYADDRYKVREYFFNRPDVYCCNIITFNTIKMRGAIKDVARAFNMPVDEAQSICNTVYEDDNGKECVPDDIRKKHSELFFYVDMVIGTITSLGRHAAGIVVSPTDIRYDFGVLTIDSDPRPVSQIDMHEIDSLNYVKMDLLGLNAVGLIDKACKLAGIPDLTPDMVNFSDENVIRSIAEDTTMIFQFESGFASESLRKTFSKETVAKIKEKNKDISYLDIMAMVSGAIRPAGESYRDALFNGEYRDNGEDALNEFLAPTLGYLVYQEQIIEFLNKFCGFTMGQADIIRRCVDENTLITTGYGYQKAIKDLTKGDSVISYNESGYSEVDVVNEVFDNGVQSCFKVTTQNGNELICTGSHKVLTQDGYKQVSELSDDDWIMAPTKIVCARDGLRPNQRLSADTMFMIGLLIGDGSLCSNSPSYVNHEIELVKKYKKCVEQLSRSKTKCEFYISEADGKTVDKVYTVRIASNAYREALNSLLKKLDINKPSIEKSVSDELMSYPADVKLSNLLAGLFNSDGGYNIGTATIEYSSISEKLVLQIKCMLLKYGIYSYITKSNVKDYDYYVYVLHISHADSINIFKREIWKYMIGKKKLQFEQIFILSEKTKTFDYLLPQKCKKEILMASSLSGKSIRSLALDSNYELEVKNQYPSISNTKAEYFVSRLYCPETYRMLTADYIPLKIKSIELVGERHVYDIEVAKNHNYIANGLIVHNCFAKKTGTEKYIPVIRNGGYIETIRGEKDDRYVPGYIKVAQGKYGMTQERAEKSIEYFLRVIEDASSYLFSKNHSVPYSMIGLYIGYLRYYYPLQLLTAALNVYKKNEAKMLEIKDYVRSKGIEIYPAKFRKSRAEYFMDIDKNCIYQDIESIKECNARIAEELYELGKNKYDDFVDLLYDIFAKTSLDKTQLDILIKLDFFSEFGDINKLLFIVEKYKMVTKRKTWKKNELDELGIAEEVIRKYSGTETVTRADDIDAVAYVRDLGVSDPEKQLEDCIKYKYMKTDKSESIKTPNGYSMKKVIKKFPASDDFVLQHGTKIVIGGFSDINYRGLLKYMFANTEINPCSLSVKIQYQEELLGRINYIDPKLDKRFVVVMNMDTKWTPTFRAYCLNNGKTAILKIHKTINKYSSRCKYTKVSFKEVPLKDGDIIYMTDTRRLEKIKKTSDGFAGTGEFEWWLESYYKVTDI